MIRKKPICILLAIIMVLGTAAAFTGCGSDDESEDTKTKATEASEAAEEVVFEEAEMYYSDDAYVDESAMTDEELDRLSQLEQKAAKLNQDEKNFYGTWETVTEGAHEIYGDLKFVIKEDGTFDADVTEEKFSGTWKKVDGGIKYKSVLMEGKMFYGKTCQMIIENEGVSVAVKKTR